MTEFDVLRTAASGMDAQRASLEVAARNVAAAEVDPRGHFTRLLPRFAVSDASSSDEDDDAPPEVRELSGESEDDGGSIRFIGTKPERGVDVDAITEMVAVLDAQRAYEANASVFDAGKRLMERTIDLGRL